jgi:hypothetical protein
VIRKAKPADLAAIVDIAIESVSKNPLPVIIDREAIFDEGMNCLGPANFCWVSEIDGIIVAAVVASVSPSFWHERATCSVLLYYTRVPGEGGKLLRAFSKWVKGRPRIKVAVIEFEPDVDPRLIKFMKRLGFTRETKNVSFVRGLDEQNSQESGQGIQEGNEGSQESRLQRVEEN